MTDWTAFAERCLAAPMDDPDGAVNEELRALCREICLELMSRDDYPLIGTLMSGAVTLGKIDDAVRLIEELFPGWGYQVGKPLTVRSPCGWYASIFRERRGGEPPHPHPGSFDQDGRDGKTPWRYANSPALALMAALFRVMAANAPGASALPA